MTRQYASPEAFKQALEARIRKAARAAGLDMGRLRQILVYDRFLARVFEELHDGVMVKGGVVLELRLERARTTRDVDLRVAGDPDRLLESLQRAGPPRARRLLLLPRQTPASWAPIYARMAKKDALPWSTIDALERVIREFIDPLLGGARGTWEPKEWTWSET